ncbi:hypothetical protein DRW41_07375 [Neobacillus piezotolerans]|uniref:Uncharacterized protein n=1 Tax=Neobacillus piezotolerans TaxID=2259171 RepID=A0A3D8GT60_9BACI|nr:hypothetical protein DRW41_07375 [Neobacillus piezotolerans]
MIFRKNSRSIRLLYGFCDCSPINVTRGRAMKLSRYLLLAMAILAIGIISACSSLDTKDLALDSKHAAMPDYVMNSSKKVQETYLLAAQYPEVLESVPCYCGCAADGHENNLHCFIAGMDGDMAVTEWDPHGIS